MIQENGVPTPEDIARVTPSRERMGRGPVAIIECFQRIPCDPCHDLCHRGAVKPFVDPNDLPEIDYELCNGCGLCVAGCPGVAIFVVDQTYSPTEALVKIPYEFLPLPRAGELVQALDRRGEVVGTATVVAVQKTKSKTWIISLVVPKEMVMTVRNLKLMRERE